MPNYRRSRIEGGLFFLTVVTHQRRPILCLDWVRPILNQTLRGVQVEKPFEIRAIVLLPDHFHTIWKMPPEDSDYSTRMNMIKKRFTIAFLSAGGKEGGTTPSRQRHRVRGVWEKRFYEHTIRNYRDYARHLDYIHFNPVRHGFAARAADWPWSTFKSFVAKGWYDLDWHGRIELPGGADIEPDEW